MSKFGAENKTNVNKIFYKSGFFRKFFGKVGWYLKSSDGKIHGPYRTEDDAEHVLFYDKHYG